MVGIIKSIRSYLFGTWDRGLSFISFASSILSLSATIFLWKNPENIPNLIVTRDIIIVLSLLLISGVLFFKFIKQEFRLKNVISDLKTSNQRLYSSMKNFHRITHQFRNGLFSSFKESLTEDISINQNEKKCFEKNTSFYYLGFKTIF